MNPNIAKNRVMRSFIVTFPSLVQNFRVYVSAPPDSETDSGRVCIGNVKVTFSN